MAEETTASTASETAGNAAATGATGDTQGQQGSATQDFDWKSLIPEELKGEAVWNDIKDAPTLMKRFVDNHKYNVGALRLPPKGAHPSAWNEVYNKLGRPESPDKYEIALPPTPEGMPWDDDAVGGFKAKAHELGLNSQQLQGIMDFYGDFLARATETVQQQTKVKGEETRQALQQEYGPVTFDRHLRTVQAFVRAEGNPALIAELDRTGWGNHPELTRLLIRVAEDWKSDQVAQGMKEEDFTGMPSPQAAKSEYERIMADMKGPYWNKDHPEHQSMRQKVSRLSEIAHPNERRAE